MIEINFKDLLKLGKFEIDIQRHSSILFKDEGLQEFITREGLKDFRNHVHSLLYDLNVAVNWEN